MYIIHVLLQLIERKHKREELNRPKSVTNNIIITMSSYMYADLYSSAGTL